MILFDFGVRRAPAQTAVGKTASCKRCLFIMCTGLAADEATRELEGQVDALPTESRAFRLREARRPRGRRGGGGL